MFQTALYLASLACAIAWCYRQPAVPWHRLGASAACIAVTWFYIIRFMLSYEGYSPFDGAYADVIFGGKEGNWGNTQMLLTWAVVAMVWSHEAGIAYQVFGVFGAMSASFLVYRPPDRPPHSAPLAYVLAAAVAFACTWMLPRSGSPEELSWWLWGLHAALLAPKVLPFGQAVDLCPVYALLAALCLGTHAAAPASPWPATDCRVSITVDLLVCSLVTLLHVHARSRSPTRAALCALLVPLVSPGCILALAAAEEQGLRRRLTTLLQRATAGRLRARRCNGAGRGGGGEEAWANLGYWKELSDPSDYVAACRALADIVGKAALIEGDRVLCVGCGAGEELGFFREAYSLASATGLDADGGAAAAAATPRAASAAKANVGQVRLVRGLAEHMASIRHTGFRHGDFDKIVAVDSVYHCDKARFFADCGRLLPRGEAAAVAVTDVVLSSAAPRWVRWALEAMNIPWGNHWTEAEYKGRLAEAGLELRSLDSLEPHVLARWLPGPLRRHLDYVLVTAAVTNPQPRPTAAIVGSGMSGCLAARLLSETHDVTVFEAGPAVNLAGRAIQIEGVTVDVPLRMIAPHYYAQMVRTIEEVAVPTKPTRFDVCLFNEARTLFITHADGLRTCLERMTHLGTLLRLSLAILLSPPCAAVTFGAYMRQHGLADSEVYRIFVLPQLSWMLSCDFSMVEGYPATAVVAFIRSINPLLAFAKGIVRVSPCNEVLEKALIAGVRVKVGQEVGRIGEDRVVCGERFDAVVVATEAGAVPKILATRPWSAIFGEFQYHPSSVVLHRDRALMPPRGEEWRVLNVRVAEGEPSCMLTVWMNAYYGGGGNETGPFRGDVFQTWNPHMRPREDTVIQESHFQRVVHTADSGRLQRAVAELQGKEGFYFAGSYVVHGLGLLEEATESAQVAVAALQRDLAAVASRRTAAGGADAKCP